jgi:hypothetical protein
MALVKSIQHFSLDLLTETKTVEGALTGQVTANCVPYITGYVTTAGALYFTDYSVDINFDGTDVVVERDNAGATGTLTVQLAVVEYDPANVRVQSGAYTMSPSGAGYQAITPSIPTPVSATATAYSLAYGFQSAGSPTWERFQVRSRITDTDTLTLDRADKGAQIDGHWYVVEALNGGFTVQPSTINITGTSADDDTLNSINVDKTMLIGSFYGTNYVPAYDTEHRTLAVELLNDTTIRAWRKSTGSGIDWSGYAVTFTGGDEVRRGKLVDQVSETSYNDTIDPQVVVANSMAIHAGNVGYLSGGAFPGDDLTDSTYDAQVELQITSPTNIQMRHSVINSSADNDISWEVVQWDLGAAPPSTRRVMVIG